MEITDDKIIIPKQYLVTNDAYFNELLQENNVLELKGNCYYNEQLDLGVISCANGFIAYHDVNHIVLKATIYKAIAKLIEQYNVCIYTNSKTWTDRIYDCCNLIIKTELSDKDVDVINKYSYRKITINCLSEAIQKITANARMLYVYGEYDNKLVISIKCMALYDHAIGPIVYHIADAIYLRYNGNTYIGTENIHVLENSNCIPDCLLYILDDVHTLNEKMKYHPLYNYVTGDINLLLDRMLDMKRYGHVKRAITQR